MPLKIFVIFFFNINKFIYSLFVNKKKRVKKLEHLLYCIYILLFVVEIKKYNYKNNSLFINLYKRTKTLYTKTQK